MENSMKFKFKIGDKVRLLTPEELEQEKGLYVDHEGDIMIADSAQRYTDDDLVTLFSDDLVTLFSREFTENQGNVFKITHQKDCKFPMYEMKGVDNGLEIGDVSELVIVSVDESLTSLKAGGVNVEVNTDASGVDWTQLGESALAITPNGILGVNSDTALEQARKIMEHAVSMVNSLGVKVGFVDYEVDGEEQSFISLENKYGIYVSKDEFGQGGKFDE